MHDGLEVVFPRYSPDCGHGLVAVRIDPHLLALLSVYVSGKRDVNRPTRQLPCKAMITCRVECGLRKVSEITAATAAVQRVPPPLNLRNHRHYFGEGLWAQLWRAFFDVVVLILDLHSVFLDPYRMSSLHKRLYE
jgi:hypothetical protein